MMFHHDMIHAEIPSKGTFLYSVEIPSTGGNTLFASGYAAYDTLDPAIRDRLEDRKAFHHYNFGSTIRGDGKGVEAFAESMHPVFRTHEETGRKAVYVNRLMTMKVEGLPDDESDRLLNALWDHSERPEFVYEHVWRVGDLVLWDNRCSTHARTDFPATERRLCCARRLRGRFGLTSFPKLTDLLEPSAPETIPISVLQYCVAQCELCDATSAILLINDSPRPDTGQFSGPLWPRIGASERLGMPLRS
jgi:hypothetical protein